MTAETEIKVWEHSPIPFSSLREKVMAFCYEHHVAPDDLLIAPFADQEHDTVTQMGFRISIIERD